MMDARPSRHLGSDSAATYRIEVEGMVPESWSECYSGMTVTTERGADDRIVTCLAGRVEDQSALTGMLDALVECHLRILRVESIDPDNRGAFGGPGDDERDSGH